MNEDIIVRITACPDNIDECWELLQEASNEIKRLRGQVECQSESIQILCRDLDPQLLRLMKEKRELRDQLAAKDDHIAQHLITINMHYQNVMTLQATVKRLEGQIAAREDLIADEVSRRKALGEMCERKDDEICKWQQVAIDLKTKALIEYEEPEVKFDLAEIAHCPDIRFSCDEECEFENCPSKEFWRSVAAKELGIQISQKDSYLKRLEEAYLRFVRGNVADHFPECDPDTEAQVALEKIRQG